MASQPFWARLQVAFPYIVVCAAFLFLNFFSLRTLTTQPRFWYDEGMNVEMARNFADFGVLDLIVSPHTFTEKGLNMSGTGYTTIVPLAGFFKLFGFGLEQARLYMLVWMNVFLIAIFLFAKKQWGALIAALTTVFFVTFPPFYGNGRTVMGEIPGFLFLLLALWAYLEKRPVFQVGILAGLAAVTKPSVYVFALPALAGVLFFESYRTTKNIFTAAKHVIFLALSTMVALIPWIYLFGDALFNSGTWHDIGHHFADPTSYDGHTIAYNIRANLISFFQTGTLIYMTLIGLAIAGAAYFNREFLKQNKKLLLFTVVFSPFALAYYLKLPGYLRYLIAWQFLLLVLLAPSLFALASYVQERIGRKITYVMLSLGIGGLLMFQGVYLFTGAKLYYSNSVQNAVDFVERSYPEATFGVVNSPPISSLLPSDRKYVYLDTYGLRETGVAFTTLPIEQLPQIVFVDTETNPSFATFIAEYYETIADGPEGVPIYRLKSTPLPR